MSKAKFKQLEIPFPLPTAEDLAREKRIRTIKQIQKILNNFAEPTDKDVEKKHKALLVCLDITRGKQRRITK